MNTSRLKKQIIAGSLASTVLLLSACSDNDNNSSTAAPADVDFEVQVINLTNAQPLSPPAIILHGDGYHAFVDGQAASEGLEMLAEGGDNDQLIADAQSATEYLTHFDAAAPVGPKSQSGTYTVTVTEDELNDLQLTVVSMLVHTNDGFAAVDAHDLSALGVGASMTLNTPTWDSGTEANTEATDTIPGPGFGGEGFNATQDDAVGVVRFHQGIVGNTLTEDGLATSVLGEEHRFDNPSMRVVITRLN